MSDVNIMVGSRLNTLLVEAGLEPLEPTQSRRFEEYLSLFIRWNAKINLSAVRDEEGILSRHFVESIACARALPSGLRTLLDFGSGAGLPGIPIALCRPEVSVTLAETQGKKVAFLCEAVRVLGVPVAVHGGRAESIGVEFDCVVLRAVDRMPRAVAAAARLVAPRGWLALMTTRSELAQLHPAAGAEFSWSGGILLARGTGRVLALGQRREVQR